MKHRFCNNYGEMLENIIEFSRDYVDKSKVKALVIGMSGGIDSALTAALASEVCDRCSGDVKLVGRILPIQSDQTEMARAESAAKAFCHEFRTIDMGTICSSLTHYIMGGSSAGVALVRKGNVKARLRMIKLYDTAKAKEGLVLSTDNYTEYLLGFWTLHGDVGDYGMMQNLWKTEVYGLANYLMEKYKKENELYKAVALMEGIKAVPTDGLGISKSDFDQIHPNYDKNSTPVDVYGRIDVILLNHLNMVIGDGKSKIIKRHMDTGFKRINPFNMPRKDIVG